MDADGDGRISREEARAGVRPRFDLFDANRDGYITGPEVVEAHRSDVRPPEQVYSDRMTIRLGGKRVELIHPAPAHSDDMTVVFFPEERVVFAVDFVNPGAVGGGAGFGPTTIRDWVKALKTVETLDFDRG